MVMTYGDWCEREGCDHGHCSRYDCEHPQPIVVEGELLCGRCAIVDGVASPLVPCRPGVCDE